MAITLTLTVTLNPMAMNSAQTWMLQRLPELQKRTYPYPYP